MQRLEFLKKNAPWLGAGGLLTFGSSFGQTYFISIYAGEIRGTFGLSHAEWGGLYAVGTSIAAVMMLLLGSTVDRFRARDMAMVVVAGLIAMCLAMAFAPSIGVLLMVIVGLRFFGQGMMPHIAIVSISRWFAATRGRAISIVHLGFAFGKALLPLIYVLLMGAVGWRISWMIAAAQLLLFLPILALLLRNERNPQNVAAETVSSPGLEDKHWTRNAAMKHWLFWTTLPAFLTLPIFGTALFFQQVHLTELKDWPLEAFVGLMPMHTAAELIGLFVGGMLVDRLGCTRLIPFYLLPTALGFVILAVSPSLFGAAVALSLMGLSQGASAGTLGAYWPEIYGTKHLGAIRSVAVAVMVLASGLGPLLTGVLIDAGIDFRWQLIGMGIYAAGFSAINAGAMWKIRRRAIA